jgi:hypothetical protein
MLLVGVEMGPNARVWHGEVREFHTVGCLEALSLYIHRVTHDASALRRVPARCKKGTTAVQKRRGCRSDGAGD